MIRWLKRLALAVLALLLLAVLLGLGWERWARGSVARDLPFPGRMVDVGDHALHFHCVGEGRPTVVLEAGLGPDASTSWDPVLEELAEVSRVCAYDRAGLLWSESGPEPRDAEQAVTELHALLAAAGEPTPVILVGHSLGGLYARLYAGRHPDEVAGLVLVDASHPEQMDRMPADAVAAMESALPPPLLMRLMATTGVLRWTMVGPPGSSTEEVAPVAAFFPTSVPSFLGEVDNLQRSSEQARGVTDLGDLPLVVLVAGRFGDAPPGVADEVVAQMEAFLNEGWPVLQQEQADLSSRGELRMVDEASHYIHHDDPAAVVQAVADVVRWVREGTGPTEGRAPMR